MNFITFYWYHDQVQLMNTYENKNYDHNFIIEDFREKNRIIRNRTIQKNGKNIFSIKDINWSFLKALERVYDLRDELNAAHQSLEHQDLLILVKQKQLMDKLIKEMKLFKQMSVELQSYSTFTLNRLL